MTGLRGPRPPVPRVGPGGAATIGGPLVSGVLALAVVLGPATLPVRAAPPVSHGPAPAPARPSRPAPAPPAPAPAPPATTQVIDRGQPLARAGLRYRSGQYVGLVAARSVTYTVPAGQRPLLSLVAVPREVSGPLAAGAPEGSAVFRVEGQTVARVALVTARAVAAASLGQRLRDYFSRPLTLALLGGLLVCSLLLVILRRRATRRRRARVERRAGTEVA